MAKGGRGSSASMADSRTSGAASAVTAGTCCEHADRVAAKLPRRASSTGECGILGDKASACGRWWP